MPAFVTDTHPLIWYATNKHSSLSKEVLRTFEQADTGELLIYIPTVVFWEIGLLERLGKIHLRDGFGKWSTALLSQTGFEEAVFNLSIVERGLDYNFNDDIFDAVIVATALYLDLPLISKDVAISEAGVVNTLW